MLLTTIKECTVMVLLNIIRSAQYDKSCGYLGKHIKGKRVLSKMQTTQFIEKNTQRRADLGQFQSNITMCSIDKPSTARLPPGAKPTLPI